MQISEIQNQPAILDNLLPKTRQNGDTKEFTAQFKVAFNYSPNIFGLLLHDGEVMNLDLWDDEGSPTTSIPYVPWSREFENFTLSFKRNNRSVLEFTCEKLHKFRTTAKSGGTLEVEFLAFGVTSEKANTAAIHKLVKDPSITLSIEAAGMQQGEL